MKHAIHGNSEMELILQRRTSSALRPGPPTPAVLYGANHGPCSSVWPPAGAPPRRALGHSANRRQEPPAAPDGLPQADLLGLACPIVFK